MTEDTKKIIYLLMFAIAFFPSVIHAKSIYSYFEKGKELYDKQNYKSSRICHS